MLLPISFEYGLLVNCISGHLVQVISCILDEWLILEAQASVTSFLLYGAEAPRS